MNANKFLIAEMLEGIAAIDVAFLQFGHAGPGL
jgi:hypothetical protein